MPSREAQALLRGVHPLPSRQGETQVRGVQLLPSRQAEKELRGVQETLLRPDDLIVTLIESTCD